MEHSNFQEQISILRPVYSVSNRKLWPDEVTLEVEQTGQSKQKRHSSEDG